MRALGVTRLSRDKDTSTSIERQEEQIRLAAKLRGDTLVAITSDTDVSGKVSPFERPGLGPWLNGRAGEYDTLIVAKLDRLTRSLFGFVDLMTWAADHGKNIVSVTESIDLDTPHGRMVANVLVSFAQFERERMGERRREAAEKVSAAGGWDGGTVPFGYSPVAVNGGWRLGEHAMNARTARQMVRDAIGGLSLADIARGLNEAAIPSPTGGTWRGNSVRRILTSPAMAGHQVKVCQGVIQAVHGRDGKPVKMTDEPVIDQDQYEELQLALASRARGRGQAQSRHLLWGVAFCARCGGKMYGHRRVSGAETRRNYYACKNCRPWMSVRLEELNGLLERILLREAGERVVHERKLVRGDEHAAEIRRLERKAQRLRAELADEHDDDLASALQRNEERVADLREQYVPDRLEWVPVASGESVAAMWARLGTKASAVTDTEEGTGAKNRLLRDWGVVILVGREGITGKLGWLEQDSGRFPLGQKLPMGKRFKEVAFKLGGDLTSLAEDDQ